jgi:hypothetical protein
MQMKLRFNCLFLIIIFLFNLSFSSQILSGTVKDGAGASIEGATVQLVIADKSTVTDAGGNWQFNLPMTIKMQRVQNGSFSAVIQKGLLAITIHEPLLHVKVSLYQLDGTLIDCVTDKKLPSGHHTINLIRQSLPPKTVLIKADIGGTVTYFKLPVMASMAGHIGPVSKGDNTTSGHLAKVSAVIDTIKVTKSGYQTAAIAIESYKSGPHHIVLKKNGVSYRLPPPSYCHSWDYVPDCIPGNPNTKCGGVCNTINACSESQTSKPGADVTFICPRFMLHSPEMLQAAIDDGNEEYLYAVVGHDVDFGFIDGDEASTCCNCYQIIYAYPSPDNEKQVQLNPDDVSKPASAVPIPKPIIAQSFNTAATKNTFDIYMGGGGFGAHNGCGPGLGATSTSGQYLYEAYPEEGGYSGGVKPITHWSECKNQYQWVTEASLGSEKCQDKVTQTCNEITHADPKITEYARKSCIEANQVKSLHHANWSVYVRRVECPEALTRVTGCKLQDQGLPKVDGLITAEQAAKDNTFWKKGSNGKMYETTTMEDCCRPSCAAADWVQKKGLPADPNYNVFYSCDRAGVPITQPEK